MFAKVLQQDHREIDELMAAVTESLDAGDYEGSRQTLDLFWARLAVHIRAEHLVLFPVVTEAIANEEVDEQFAALSDVINGLRSDHDHFMYELAGVIKLMGSIDPADGGKRRRMGKVRERLGTVREQLARHNRIEEETLYPLESLLSRGRDVVKVTERLKAQLENMPARFKRTDGPRFG
jgi:iron-sulfur cluster repair protein YtfE (RIC family)